MDDELIRQVKQDMSELSESELREALLIERIESMLLNESVARFERIMTSREKELVSQDLKVDPLKIKKFGVMARLKAFEEEKERRGLK